jgi:para-aminobenzoate synthetase component 1
MSLFPSLIGRVVTTSLPGPASPEALLDALAEQDDPAMLESTAADPRFGRYSILSCLPIDVLELQGDVLRDRCGKILASDSDAVWDAMKQAFERVKLAGADMPESDGPAYCPGWIGYIGYEVGRTIERLPGRAQRDTALPDLRLGLYDAMLLFDAVESTWQLVEIVFESPPPLAGRAAKILRKLLAEAGQVGRRGLRSEATQPRIVVEHGLPIRTCATLRQASRAPRAACSNFTPAEYQQTVARCLEYIAAGDIFQVNLSQRFAIDDAPEAVEIYRRLRRRNPAWYSAFLRFTSDSSPCAIVSSSPELFLRCRGRTVTTRPIKGTRPRIGQADRDRAAAAELLASKKDNAELAMIIDLLRNDLGRVCKFGTVRVTDPVALEAHPTVFHLVGTVVGRLRDEVGPAELLRATFPGGSITGAPKIRAMEIIDELEPVARGVYTGCVGIVGVDGSAEWNIAIRTVVCDRGRALISAGGGIVADSTPRGEYDETLDKARALLDAVAEAD